MVKNGARSPHSLLADRVTAHYVSPDVIGVRVLNSNFEYSFLIRNEMLTFCKFLILAILALCFKNVGTKKFRARSSEAGWYLSEILYGW